MFINVDLPAPFSPSSARVRPRRWKRTAATTTQTASDTKGSHSRMVIKVNRVELKNILPPREIQNAMEKQMKAERERREAILRAEGEKRSAILTAEGEKESAILRADAKKQEQILEAQGRAEAILTVQRATAEGIRLINESMPSDAVIKLKSLEAFAAAADGRATKIIIPSEIQGVAALAAGLVESVKGEAPNA